MKYAGPFRRLCAAFVDALVLAPLSVFTFWAMSALTGPALAVLFPLSLVAAAYHIWFHARSGQTIGKRVAEIRVVSVSGERISWREAIRRSAVDVLLAIPVTLSVMLALGQLTPEELNLGFAARAQLLGERGPDWGRYVRYASNIWYWSEFLTMLFNTRRRALHDYIAGTVVVNESAAAAEPEERALGSA